MLDSDDDPLLAAVSHLDDAAASLRRSGVDPVERAALLRLISEVQRMIMVARSDTAKGSAPRRLMVGNPIN